MKRRRAEYRGPGTLCMCGREPKFVWQIVGEKCFAKLSLELKARVASVSRKSASEDDRRAVRDEVVAFLKEAK